MWPEGGVGATAQPCRPPGRAALLQLRLSAVQPAAGRNQIQWLPGSLRRVLPNEYGVVPLSPGVAFRAWGPGVGAEAGDSRRKPQLLPLALSPSRFGEVGGGG